MTTVSPDKIYTHPTPLLDLDEVFRLEWIPAEKCSLESSAIARTSIAPIFSFWSNTPGFEMRSLLQRGYRITLSRTTSFGDGTPWENSHLFNTTITKVTESTRSSLFNQKDLPARPGAVGGHSAESVSSNSGNAHSIMPGSADTVSRNGYTAASSIAEAVVEINDVSKTPVSFRLDGGKFDHLRDLESIYSVFGATTEMLAEIGVKFSPNESLTALDLYLREGGVVELFSGNKTIHGKGFFVSTCINNESIRARVFLK